MYAFGCFTISKPVRSDRNKMHFKVYHKFDFKGRGYLIFSVLCQILCASSNIQYLQYHISARSVYREYCPYCALVGKTVFRLNLAGVTIEPIKLSFWVLKHVYDCARSTQLSERAWKG